MDYLPVFAETKTTTAPEKPSRKILYYKNPMGLADTSAVPKKDSMGMDYTPVYADEDAPTDDGMLQLSTEKIQKLGVKTAMAMTQRVVRGVRSLGVVETDERRLHNISLRFDGYVERLLVNVTGQTVSAGQPLLEIYSPELLATQNEVLIAKNSRSSADLASVGLERLRNWGIAEAELQILQREGKPRRNLTVRSPAAGVVMEKSVIAGSRVMAGETLFKIADLSQLWIMAEVYEQDVGLIQVGQKVSARFESFPGQVFEGQLDFVYPILNPATRTARVRIQLPNPDGRLKPNMYAQLEIAAQAHQALAVPASAIVESGRHTLVLVDRGEGRFEPREVTLGLRGEDATEILEGLKEHEMVVTSANFLLDAESNLKAALGSFEAPSKSLNPLPAGEGRVRAETSNMHKTFSETSISLGPHPNPSPAGEGLENHSSHGVH
jgi:Cu(I)/Ag(I) efflux system membrane fusion protein